MKYKHTSPIQLRAWTLGLAGLVLALGMNFAAPPVAGAAVAAASHAGPAGPAQNWYVVKLRGADAAVLRSYAPVVEQKFAFSASEEFENIYSFSSGLGLEDLRQKLAGKFEYLDRDWEVSVRDTVIVPNDPGFTSDELNTRDQWGLAKADFPEAWNVTQGSTANIVAVIDTGIDATHADLRKVSFRPGFDFTTNTDIYRRTNSDDNGHGTLVAGVIGAVPNNGIGIAGTNWKVSLMPLKALDKTGSGTSSNVSEAIVWAADHGAHIINLSLGGVGFAHDNTLSNAISYAFKRNVVIIAAAGNDAATTGGNLDNDPVFPICADNGQNMVIGVTAMDHNDVKPAFANYGKACIDVSAPGRRILSTINHDPLTGENAPNSYAYASGTSLAVPHVTGLAALIRAASPGASNTQIRGAIISAAENVDAKNFGQCDDGSCEGLLGAGRINAVKSLAKDLAAVRLNEGDVVRVGNSGTLYYIAAGKRHLISPFVKQQRFSDTAPKQISEAALNAYPDGGYATPRDGTLIKIDNSPDVYYMLKGMRLPVTYQVFLMRNLKFTSVNTLSYTEVNSWLAGSFLPPPEGTLVRTGKNPTVYWVVSGVLHPVNHGFYTAQGLQVFPTVYVADEDIQSFPKGEPYIK